MLFYNLRRLERVLTEMSTRKRGMATRRSMDDSVNPVAASQMLGLLSDCQNIPLMMLIVVVDDVCCCYACYCCDDKSQSCKGNRS